MLDPRLTPDLSFQHGDQLVHCNGLVPAQVDDLITKRLETQDGAAGDIIDIGETA